MLLSEVLQIAKDIKKYHKLNEALKSSILTQVFHKLDNTSLNLQPLKKSWYTDDNDHRQDCWVNTYEGAKYYDIEYRYENKARRGTLTQEDCDTVEGRTNMIGYKYKKASKSKSKYAYHDEYNGGTIYRILTTINELTGMNVGISEISDDNIVKVNMEEAKKKQYKFGLQFWMDYEDNLKAVTKDNKIILLLDYADYTSWYTVNPDYHEKTDFSNFDRDRKSLEEFIGKAFIRIPVIKIYTKASDIKSVIKTNNIKGLQSLPGIDYVYVVNETGLQHADYTEKKLNRKQYKQFLEKQLDIAKDNIRRYKDIIKVRRSQNIDSTVISKVNQLYELCMDATIDLQNIEMNELSTMTDSQFYSDSFLYNRIDLKYYYTLKDKIRESFGKEGIYTYNYGSRNQYTKEMFTINSIGDLFFLYNTIINVFILLIDKVIRSYEQYNTAKNKQDNISNLTFSIDLLKKSYKDLSKEILSYKSITQEIDKSMNKVNPNIINNIDNIFDKFYNFQFDDKKI